MGAVEEVVESVLGPEADADLVLLADKLFVVLLLDLDLLAALLVRLAPLPLPTSDSLEDEDLGFDWDDGNNVFMTEPAPPGRLLVSCELFGLLSSLMTYTLIDTCLMGEYILDRVS
jgi:hypothetical protein